MPRDLVWMAVGAAAVAAGAQISDPTVPVPTTLQTLAVVTVALLRGPWIGAGAAALYLGLVLLDLPVLSGGRAHGDLLALPSAGYVVGFLPGAAVTGAIGRRAAGIVGWTSAALTGHATVLAIGVPTLAM